MKQDCEKAVEKHKREHAESRGSYHLACAEGWCGCLKNCGHREVHEKEYYLTNTA